MKSQQRTLSVVIVTWRRPAFVQEALLHLAGEPVDQVVVVDASEDDSTAAIVARFPDVTYVQYAGGAGHMTRARNMALLYVTSELVAFIDDDAYVQPGWADALRSAFDEPMTGAVAGRAVSGPEELKGPHYDSDPSEPIGSIRPDGTLVANFDRSLAAPVEVTHGIGANMAFRTTVLADLGGLRDDFPGTEIREDADLFLRVGAVGWRVLYQPLAVVVHVGAPHVQGQRFNWRYMFYSRHNHFLLLGRNFGLGSKTVRHWFAGQVRELVELPHEESVVRASVRMAYGILSLLTGMTVCLGKAGWRPRDPRLSTALATRIRAHLGTLGGDLTREHARRYREI